MVIYAITKIVDFATSLPKKEEKPATTLDDLEKEAQEVAQKKREILDTTEATKSKINNINDTLN